MSTKVERNYLEINSLKDLKKPKFSPDDCLIDLSDPTDFQINKFFYKNIGKEHRWTDRLVWTDEQWIKYISDQKVKTYNLKKANDFAGYFELIFHEEKKETEIAYFLDLLTNAVIRSSRSGCVKQFLQARSSIERPVSRSAFLPLLIATLDI